MLNLTHDELINLKVFLDHASLPIRMELDPNAKVKCDLSFIATVKTKVDEQLQI